MKLIILAAGKGTRLLPLTRNTPKSLLHLADGVSILEHQLNNARESGIREVVIVTGYRSEQIEAKVRSIEDLNIRIVFNPFYDAYNNLVSAWVARHEMDEPFVLVNGDDVFSPHVLQGLIRSPGEITMVVARKEKYDVEDMKVIVQGDRVVRVGKEIDLSDANGESIGMILFQKRGCTVFADRLDQMVRMEENLQKFYLKALQEIMDSGFPVHFHECRPTDWAEIDFHPDLTFIRENVSRWSGLISQWEGAREVAAGEDESPQSGD